MRQHNIHGYIRGYIHGYPYPRQAWLKVYFLERVGGELKSRI